VVCPDCGKQEARGHAPDQTNFDRPVSRHVNPRDMTCPKCGSDTVPFVEGKTPLAVQVEVRRTEYFLREAEAVRRRHFFRDKVVAVFSVLRRKK